MRPSKVYSFHLCFGWKISTIPFQYSPDLLLCSDTKSEWMWERFWIFRKESEFCCQNRTFMYQIQSQKNLNLESDYQNFTKFQEKNLNDSDKIWMNGRSVQSNTDSSNSVGKLYVFEKLSMPHSNIKIKQTCNWPFHKLPEIYFYVNRSGADTTTKVWSYLRWSACPFGKLLKIRNKILQSRAI